MLILSRPSGIDESTGAPAISELTEPLVARVDTPVQHRILAVEDEGTMARLVSRALAAAAFEVNVGESGLPVRLVGLSAADEHGPVAMRSGCVGP